MKNKHTREQHMADSSLVKAWILNPEDISGANPVTGETPEVNTPEDITKDSTVLAVADPTNPQFQNTSAASLTVAESIAASDDTWLVFGSIIDCRNYHNVGLFIDFIVNDSIGNQLQILVSTDDLGTNEYVLETTAEYQKTLGDSNIKIFYQFNVENIPYIRIQTKATTKGTTSATASINYTLDY